MKRFIIALAVLSVLLGTGIAVSLAFRHAHQPTIALLEEAKAATLTGDWANAEDHLQQAQQRWEDYRHFTAAFSDHAPMEEIDALFAQLEVYAQLKDAHRFPALCAHLAELTKAIADSHRLRWWTLL